MPKESKLLLIMFYLYISDRVQARWGCGKWPGCLNSCAPSALVSGLKYRWRPVTSSGGRYKGPIEFETFSTDLNDRTECTLGEFVEAQMAVLPFRKMLKAQTNSK